jgi:phosphohistidine phosphatase SixA
MHPHTRSRRVMLRSLLPSLAVCLAAAGATLTGRELATALQHGGYVILMRHAQSPGAPPEAAHTESENLKHERQLDGTGRASARALGDAFRRLRIPLGEVLSSPTYRALETARLAQLPAPQTFEELGEEGKNMGPRPAATRGAWLRSRVSQPPRAGTDTLIITHYPNIAEAFPSDSKDLSEGEALIFRPDPKGAATLVGRIKIEDWPKLASAQ